MTNTNLYKNLMEIKHGAQTLDDFIKTIQKAIADENAKKSGSYNLKKSMENVLKLAKSTPREALHYAHISNGFQYVCDGFQIIKTSTPQELPTLPEKMEYVDVERILRAYDIHNAFNVNLPTLDELTTVLTERKAQIKAKQTDAKTAYAYTLYTETGAECDYNININYLINALKAGCTRGTVNKYNFLFMNDSESIIYLICGVRK